MAFLIASPLLDAIVLGVLVFLIGFKLIALYAVLTFVAAMGLAALFARLGFEADVKQFKWAPVAGGSLEVEEPPSVSGGEQGSGADAETAWRRAWSRIRQTWDVTWHAFVPLVPHLLLATAIGALVRAFLPVNWLLAAAGPDQPLAIPLMAALGLPAYINAEILLPITASLVDKGMATGAVIALVITGLGMSAGEVTLLTGFFRLRLIAALVVSFFAVAVGGGLLATLIGG